MRLTEIPRLVTAMVALCLFSVFDSAPACADFSFGEPVNAGPIVNSAYADQLCCISADGLEMYIESNRPPGGWCMWVSKRASKDEDWGIPVRLGLPVNVVNGDGWTCLSADGLSLYVMSSRPGGYGGWDIWMIKRPSKDDPWGEAVNLGTPVNTALHDEAPWISQDGLVLYFSREDNALNTDIRMSTRSRETDPWGEPVKLFPAMTSANEGFPCVSSDGLMLFFADRYDTRARPGGWGNGDLWMSRRAGTADAWGTPVNLGPNVNSAYYEILPRLSPDGRTLYFSVLNRPGGYGGWDIWQAPMIPIMDFNGDAKIDEKDLALLVADWGKSNSVCDIGSFPWGDGVVDEQDLAALMTKTSGTGFVRNPLARAAEIPCNVSLTWTAVPFATSYDVYFGTSWALVSAATRASPLGMLVSQGQPATTYVPAKPLEFSKTYYWRVDFVGGGPAPTICKGCVLDFATEAYAYPIQSITATASSSQSGMGPEKTVNGFGLDKTDGHSTEPTDMWLSTGTQPIWIQYQFDKVYALHELWVWNSNQPVEPYLGFGAKTVKIEYSADGAKWTQLANVPEFAWASGQDGYLHNTTVSFGGVSAKHVKLTTEKNWGVAQPTGLSEVRFFYIPERSALKP